MIRWIKIISGLGVLLIAVIVAGVVYLKNLDINQYKELIAEKAKEATGRELKIDGDLELSVSLSPKISVEGVSFANAGWGAKPEMVTIKKFAAEIALIPLLSKQIDVEQIILEGVELIAEKDNGGRGNWEFGRSDKKEKKNKSKNKKESSDTDDFTLPVVRNVFIKDVNITYKDAQSGVQFALGVDKVTLSADGTSSPLNLDVEGRLNGQAFSMGGQLGSIDALADGEMFPLRLKIAALAATIGLDGQAGIDDGMPKTDLKLALKGARLEDTLIAATAFAPALKDLKLPVGGAYHVNAQIKLGGVTKVALENLDLGVGKLALKGRLAADLSGARPSVDAALASDTLNLDELLAKGEPKSAPKSAPAKKSDATRVFPNDRLPFEGLKAVDAKVKLTAKAIITQGMTISNVDVGVNLKAGRLAVKPLGASFGGGTISGDVVIDASKTVPALKAIIGARQVDYGQVLAERGLVDIAKGKLDANVNLTGNGESVRQIMAGLNGKTRIVTENGQLDSGVLNLASADFLNVFTSKDDKRIICGVINFDITGGMANGRAVVFETGGISVIGTGGANLASETIKMRIDLRAKKASLASAVLVPVNLKGTFAKPGVEVDAAAAVGNVAANAVRTGAALATGGLSLLIQNLAGSASAKTDNNDYCTPALAGKKVTPGKMAEAKPAGANGSAPAKPKQAAPENPVEGISKGLKSLFGN